MALILTRRPAQTICIGDDIRVTVVSIERTNQVRLAIDAPKDVVVDREEIYNAKRLDDEER